MRHAANRMSTRFLRFLIVGSIATVIQYIVLVILVEITPIEAVTASAIGFFLGAVANYFLNYRFTFESSARHRVAMPKFALTAAAGLLINTLTMAVLTRQLFVYYVFAQFIATLITLFWNFVVNSLWSFRS